MVLLVLCTVCLACGWSGVLLCCCVCLRLGMCGLIAFGWIWVANVLPVGLGSLGMGTVKEDSHAGGYWLSCAYARSGVWLGVFGKYQRLHLLPAICVQDSLAERSKAVAQGAIPKGRGFEPHSCHLCLHLASTLASASVSLQDVCQISCPVENGTRHDKLPKIKLV